MASLNAVRTEFSQWWHAFISSAPGNIGSALRQHWAKRHLQRLGSSFYLDQHFNILTPHKLSVGHHVGINKYFFANAHAGIQIGDNVLIGPSVKIWTINHNYMNPDVPIRLQGRTAKPVVIQDDVWIAANAIILPGSIIGKGAVIAAGSIVSGEIPASSVAAGQPAQKVKERGVLLQR